MGLWYYKGVYPKAGTLLWLDSNLGRRNDLFMFPRLNGIGRLKSTTKFAYPTCRDRIFNFLTRSQASEAIVRRKRSDYDKEFASSLLQVFIAEWGCWSQNILFDDREENFFALGFICIAGLRNRHCPRLLEVRGLRSLSNRGHSQFTSTIKQW